jgi:hypothetical protein
MMSIVDWASGDRLPCAGPELSDGLQSPNGGMHAVHPMDFGSCLHK